MAAAENTPAMSTVPAAAATRGRNPIYLGLHHQT